MAVDEADDADDDAAAAVAAADDDDVADVEFDVAAAVQIDPCPATFAVAHADVVVLIVSEVVFGLSVRHGMRS